MLVSVQEKNKALERDLVESLSKIDDMEEKVQGSNAEKKAVTTKLDSIRQEFLICFYLGGIITEGVVLEKMKILQEKVSPILELGNQSHSFFDQTATDICDTEDIPTTSN